MRTLVRYLFLPVLFLAVIPSGYAAEFRGLIEPHRVIKVGSPSEGVLEGVDVDRGTIVRRGQVLARLQSGVERANTELAKMRAEMDGSIKGKQASTELFKAKKARVEQLYRKQMSSPSEMEEAEANRIVSEMQLKEAVENKQLAQLDYKRNVEVMKRLTITSPVNGVVVERYLSPGEYVRDQPVMKIAQIDPLNIEVIMPASQYHSVKVGMRAKIIPEAPMKGQYAATVRVVDRVVDAASGTFGVRLEMPNPGNRLLAGLKCKVIFP
jgi:RND family efflux transporter MFP subunit